MIKLVNNYGFKWKSTANCYFKGYLFDNKVLKSEQNIFEELQQINTQLDFEQWIKQNNGCFSVIIIKNNDIFAAVDYTRTFPLFYALENSELVITDEPISVFGKKKSVNKLASRELESAAYITEFKTMFNGVYQLQAGEYLSFVNNSLQKSFYTNFLSENIDFSSFNNLQAKLITKLNDVFERLVNSLQGCQAVVPLSGGYDSRLIVLMLKKMGHSNIYTFTYGKKNNVELENSRKTAKILEVPWKFIEYNTNLIGDFVHDDVFKAYYKFASKGISMFYMQDYFAVKYLYDNKLIDDNAVFIPGHSGDFLAGSHLDGSISEHTAKSKMIDEIYAKTYSQNNHKNYKKQFVEIVKNYVNNIPNKVFAYSVMESWDLRERQAKFIVNSANVFDYFGFEYRLPFWDKELVDFFKSVPYNFKLHKILYDKTLVEFYFAPNKLQFKTELQASKFDFIKQRLKQKIKSLLPKKLKQYYLQKNDWMAYALITEKLLEDLKQRNIPYRFKADNYNSIISKWYTNSWKL